nr:hypothetical protein [Azospirillum sp. 412522]
MIVELVDEHAQQMQTVGMAWFRLEHAPIQGFCQVQRTGLMLAERIGKPFGSAHR